MASIVCFINEYCPDANSLVGSFLEAIVDNLGAFKMTISRPKNPVIPPMYNMYAGRVKNNS